jgi:hypothetical protein
MLMGTEPGREGPNHGIDPLTSVHATLDGRRGERLSAEPEGKSDVTVEHRNRSGPE